VKTKDALAKEVGKSVFTDSSTETPSTSTSERKRKRPSESNDASLFEDPSDGESQSSKRKFETIAQEEPEEEEITGFMSKRRPRR